MRKGPDCIHPSRRAAIGAHPRVGPFLEGTFEPAPRVVRIDQEFCEVGESPITQDAHGASETRAVEGADIPRTTKVRCRTDLVECIRSCAPQEDQELIDLDTEGAKGQSQGNVLRVVDRGIARRRGGSTRIAFLVDVDAMPFVSPFPQAPGDPATPKTECAYDEAGAKDDRQEVEERALELTGAKPRGQQAPRKRRGSEGAEGKPRERSNVRDDGAAGIVELRQKPSSAGTVAAGPLSLIGDGHPKAASRPLSMFAPGHRARTGHPGHQRLDRMADLGSLCHRRRQRTPASPDRERPLLVEHFNVAA